MRAPVRQRKRGLKFNITPLIDVVFLLVIFFLVASHFARTEPTETVNLPDASQTSEDENPRRLIITVDAQGNYFANTEQVSLSEVEAMIMDGAEGDPETYAVRIRGDRTTQFSMIEPIMLLCPRYGITKFGFHVLESSDN